MEQSQKPNRNENIIILCLHTLKSMHTSDDAHFVFDTLESMGLPLDCYNKRDPVNLPYDREAATLLWTTGTTYRGPRYTNTGLHFLGKRKRKQLSIMASWATSPDMDTISVLTIRVQKSLFLKRQNAFLEMFRMLITYFEPAYAYIGTQMASFRQSGPLWAQLPGIYWLNYFGEVYIDFIGQEHIEACDWHQTEAFHNGIFAWTASDIDIPDSEVLETETRYSSLLGTQYFRHSKYTDEFAEAVPPVMLKIRHMIRGENPSPCPFRLYDERQKAKE